MASWILAALVFGSIGFSVLTAIAARRYRSAALPPLGPEPPLSVLKPLAGADDGLETNLRGFFEQDYSGGFELLFAARTPDDPAVAIAERLCAAYPNVPSRMLIVGEPPWSNAKVWSLHHMTAAARHSLLVMSDSDVRVGPNFLRVIAHEFQDPALGLTTCPYRAAPGARIWSRIEAIMMNTDFFAGILVARLLEGMRFAVGPTMAARREVIEVIGGWSRMRDHLAEDFVAGRLAAEAGFGVGLSSYVIEHRIGSTPFAANAQHRLRWCRSTRRSRPTGYIGQVFTFPVPIAALLALAWPGAWPLAAAAIAARFWAAWEVAWRTLRDPLTTSKWWLVPLSDVASFAFWLGGFFGNRISWRGRTYYLHADGRFERLA